MLPERIEIRALSLLFGEVRRTGHKESVGKKIYWSESEAHQKVGQRYAPRPDIILIFPLIFFLTRAMDFVEKERLHVVLMHG